MNELRTYPRMVPVASGHGITGWLADELYYRMNNWYGEGAKPRSIWTRAISNAGKYVGVGGIEPIRADLNVMVGGLLLANGRTRSDFDTIYKRPGRSQRYRPMSGITSINITNKGELQTLRKITINWTCGSTEELDNLAPFWLSPGISVYVEWGWAQMGRSADKNTPIGKTVQDGKLRQYFTNYKYLYKDIVEPSKGNHDAFIGVITNFTWNMQEDGTYDCTTELTSMGQIFLPLDIEKSGGKQKTNTGDLKKRRSTIASFVKEYLTDKNLKRVVRKNGKTYLSTHDVIFLGEGWFDGAKKVFVSWRFIEDAVINQIAGFTMKNKDYIVKVDSTGVLVSNDRVLYSTDQDILLIAQERNEADALIFNADSQKKSGKLRNLYVEIERVKTVFEETDTIEEALKKLLNEMSKAAGDIWYFKIQEKPDSPNVLQVIDLNYTNENDLYEVQKLAGISTKSRGNRMFSFGSSYKGKSIVQSVSFTSKMTDQMAYKFFINRNADSELAIANSDNNEGMPLVFRLYRDRVLNGLDVPAGISLEDSEDALAEEEESEKEKQQEKLQKQKELLDWLINGGKEPKSVDVGYGSGIIFYDSDIAKDFLIEQINTPFTLTEDPNTGEYYKTLRKSTHHNTRFVPLYPLEISITVDGISGFLPGMCFSLDSLPIMYRGNGIFQTVDVSHDISGEDWTTTIRAFFKVVRTQSPQGIKSPTREKDE